MDYQTLHMKTVVELRKLAKELGAKVPAGTAKSRLVEIVLEAQLAAANRAADAHTHAQHVPQAASVPKEAEKQPVDGGKTAAAIEAGASAPAEKPAGKAVEVPAENTVSESAEAEAAAPAKPAGGGTDGYPFAGIHAVRTFQSQEKSCTAAKEKGHRAKSGSRKQR